MADQAKQGIIVDKSFLQGLPHNLLLPLSQRYHFLMTDTLFYEMISDERRRALCFQKLPDDANPITLIDVIGAHTNHELKYFRPLGKPSSHPVPISYRFNRSLRDGTYDLPNTVREAIREENESLQIRIKLLLEAVEIVSETFPNLKSDSSLTQPKALADARLAISSNSSEMMGFVRELQPGGHRLSEIPVEIGPNWAIYRLIQTKLFFALDIYERYGILKPSTLTERQKVKLEHDVLDQEYMTLALLEGGFATEEVKLRAMYRALCPDGILLPTIAELKIELAS